MTVPESEQLLPEELLRRSLEQLPGWQRDGGTITRTFTLKGWKSAIRFVDQVAEAAARADHHPDIHVERYKTVRIVLTTHVTRGLSRADMELAAAIDALAAAG